MSVILGIDPGSRITGFGIINSNGKNHQYIASGSIKLPTSESFVNLQQIFSQISELITEYQPETAAIEQVFVHANINSALKLGQARGAAIVALAKANLEIAEYSARQVKLAVVGYGSAEKSQVQQMIKLLLQLKTAPKPDAADALAIAICHANTRSYSQLLKRNGIKS